MHWSMTQQTPADTIFKTGRPEVGFDLVVMAFIFFLWLLMFRLFGLLWLFGFMTVVAAFEIDRSASKGRIIVVGNADPI